jgi:uncharacterized membrane protein YeaQ/YmgE (transglycosylase-associated protein family)
LVPPQDRQPIDPFSETKNCRKFLTGGSDSQVNQRGRNRQLTSVDRLIKLAANMDYSAHSIIWVLVIGLVVGAIAKLLMPGKDPGGCIVTILLGIAGAFVGTWIGRLVTGNETYTARWIMSIVGAMLLLLLYRLLFRRRP